jgi:hypothetical protein
VGPAQLPQAAVHLRRALIPAAAAFALAAAGCASPIPEPRHKVYSFPKGEAFVGEPKRPYTVLGRVRTKLTWPSLSADHDEKALCDNYFNKAVRDLLARAKENGGVAVAGIQSVVFLFDGRQETYASAECSDDGDEMQILLQGVAIKWKAPPANAEEAAESATTLQDPDEAAESMKKKHKHKSRAARKKEDEFLSGIREDARTGVPRPQAVPAGR